MTNNSNDFSPSQIEDYHDNGYVFTRGLFSKEEIEALANKARNDQAMDKASSSRDDGEGNPVRLLLWTQPGDGIYGAFSRSERIVNRVEQLIDYEAYNYHSKMIHKDARTGGAWAWHQDYGYWYEFGALYPNFCSVMIAVDDATVDNGCLQILKGSHLMGRVNHTLSGQQAGADLERVEAGKERMEIVHCEMKAGGALFFHSNTLHCSAANRSENPRWAMICCYNARSNEAYKESTQPFYTKLHKMDNSKILEIAREDTGQADLNYMKL